MIKNLMLSCSEFVHDKMKRIMSLLFWLPRYCRLLLRSALRFLLLRRNYSRASSTLCFCAYSFVVTGSTARVATGTAEASVDATVVGIVDDKEFDAELL